MRKLIGIAGGVLAVSASAAAAEPAKISEVFFDFDSSSLDTQAKSELDHAATQVKTAPGATVVINAFTDPLGSATYNVALSIRRAESARDYLVAQGVDADSIVMAYFGEDAARRASFAEDRRVSVELTRDPLYTVIDRSLPIATAVTWNEPKLVAEIEGPRVEQVATRR